MLACRGDDSDKVAGVSVAVSKELSSIFIMTDDLQLLVFDVISVATILSKSTRFLIF